MTIVIVRGMALQRSIRDSMDDASSELISMIEHTEMVSLAAASSVSALLTAAVTQLSKCAVTSRATNDARLKQVRLQ